jgi:hypothetical protein
VVIDLTGRRGHPGASVSLSSICADIHYFDLALTGGRSTEVILPGKDNDDLLGSKISPNLDQTLLLGDFLFSAGRSHSQVMPKSCHRMTVLRKTSPNTPNLAKMSAFFCIGSA